jgi:hypothetical protein
MRAITIAPAPWGRALKRAAGTEARSLSWLLEQARERLGQGLRAIEAEIIAESDKISLRNP